VHFQALVDNTGALLGRPAGNNLEIDGTVDVNGDGSQVYSGVLLTGQVVEFGYQAPDAGSTLAISSSFSTTSAARWPRYTPAVKSA